MKNLQIIHIGKFFFWLSFILGNICLFGYILFHNEDFAIAGFFLLIYGGIVNAIVFISLLIYGIFYSDKAKECQKAAYILLINIPIAILYAWIGLEIL